MAIVEPPGDFAYLLDELGDTDDDFEFNDDYRVGRNQPPPPWYRTAAARVAIGAIGIAVVAILVSAVILLTRNSGGPASVIEPTTSQPPSSAAPALITTPPMIATVPPSPTESPSPTEPAASPPVVVAPPMHSEPARPPEIGVTRTPVTRQPISVRPEPRPAWPHY